MEKILAALGLKPDATPDQALKVIADLKAGDDELLQQLENKDAEIKALKAVPGKKEATSREKLIEEKMARGLPRDTAEEAVANQEADDALKAKVAKTK